MEDETEQELALFLQAVGKEKYLEFMKGCKVDDLADSEKVGQPEEIPRMVLRLLEKRAIQTYDLRALLRTAKKMKFLPVLIKAETSIDDILDENVPADVPRMVARLLKKKALEEREIQPLKDFLSEINKTKYLESLLELEISTPQQLAMSSMEALGSKLPRSIARLLLKKAQEHVKATQADEGPDYEVNLSETSKEHIKAIHETLLKVEGHSFGARFYEFLNSQDSAAAACFGGVSIPLLGRDFDDKLAEFIREIDNPAEFNRHRDAFVARLVHYGIPPSSLWFASDAFAFAAISVAPTLEQDMQYWVQLYRAIIPPLHPAILKASRTTTDEEWESKKRDFFPRMHDALARRGYMYFALWLREEQPDFVDKLWLVIQHYRAWQSDTGSWKSFHQASSQLVEGLNSDEMKALFLTILPLTMVTRLGHYITIGLSNVLSTSILSLFGIDQLRDTFRAIQRELVSEQWNEIYMFSKEEFSESFYDRFINSDPLITEMFKGSPSMAMQRENFVHQLNAVLIRINEDIEEVLRPCLIDLGARHRVHHLVGSREMLSFTAPLLATLKEMLGRSKFHGETRDAWSFVIGIMLNYMMVGWTKGVSILSKMLTDEKDRAIGGVVNCVALREFRDHAPSEFHKFFDSFASLVVGSTTEPLSAADRYRSVVNKMLDENDMSATLDRLHSLGRRHRIHHGVTVEKLGPAGTAWMSVASQTFGKRFTADAALEWALLWDTIAVSMIPEYKSENSCCPTVKELVMPFRPVAETAKVSEKTVLTLQEKIAVNDTVILRFKADQAVSHKAGQFGRLRWKIDGKNVNRYYSIASCPDPVTRTSDNLEFLIKEVVGGRVSPFLVNKIEPPASCQLLTTAGNFVLPDPVDGTQRLMISAGVGVVAFMSAIRFVVKLVRQRLVKEKIYLCLIHSERGIEFPFLQELLEISKEYDKQNEQLFFDFTLCLTGKNHTETEKNADQIKSTFPNVNLLTERVSLELLSSTLKKFEQPDEIPCYTCGPRLFQKNIRETLLKQLGHSRLLIHLEFFDL